MKATPLSDIRFDQSHERFEGQSNQQAQILQWLQNFSEKQIEERLVNTGDDPDAFRIFSVGCGSGILDLPLIKTLDGKIKEANPGGMIQYTGIDPNPVACDRFRDEFRKLDTKSTKLSVLEKTVESYQQDQMVDLTHVVHAMYYFLEPAVSLRSLIQHVAEDGELVIFQAPKGDLNLLADCFWQGHVKDPIWFSSDLAEHLKESGISFARSSLDAEVDVTACFESDSVEGSLTLDFIVQSDCRNLSQPIRASVLEFLRSISRVDDAKILAPHPVDVFVIHQPR